MWLRRSPILKILDDAASSFYFPVLDNGYIYPAATRLSAFREHKDWALVVEVFGFSPRAGLPDISIYTFSNCLHERDAPAKYATREAYENYLAKNPFNEFRSAYPIDEGDWQDADDLELVAEAADCVPVRGELVRLPDPQDYASFGIALEEPPRVFVFELCRYLAAVMRESVLATEEERRISVAPHLQKIMQLEEWRHPDLSGDERPSRSTTCRQIAEVLESGEPSRYRPTEPPNTHWSNWPVGGTL